MKRFLSLLFAIALCVSLPMQASGAKQEKTYTEYKIRTVSDLQALAKLCVLDSAGDNLRVLLENDLSLEDFPNLEIPAFGGIFDGQGHTIRGLYIDKEGAVRGLFRYIRPEGFVRNLNLAEASLSGSTDADTMGALAGVNEGTIENCTVSAIVSTGSRSAILVGVNEISGVITGCESRGSVIGSAKIGGIAGENLGCIYESENKATINAIAQDENLKLDDLRLSLISGPTTLSDATDLGGIAGFSSGVIRTCRNTAAVGYAHKGYNVGGIAGRTAGVILDCKNEGSVLARKEGGGIAGQMEPSSTLVYTEDTLQKVRKQALSMQGSVNQAVRDASFANDAVREDLYDLQGDVNETLRAVDAMLGVLGGGDSGGDGWPSFDFSDRDAITSAASGVSTALSHTAQSVYKATQSAGDGVGNVVGDMQVVASQMNGILRTLGAGGEDPTLTVDVSGENVENDGAGKIARCENTGLIRADINTGGIVGAVARENDLDPEDDYLVEGTRSASFTFRSRALIYACVNRGTVTADKRSAGGITGELRMGKILSCENYGFLDSGNARRVGGIAGLSDGNIEGAYAKCFVSGAGFVGGIVGQGGDMSGCVSMVRIANTGAYSGEIAGLLNDGAEVADNVFVGTGGAVDGISYAGKAEPTTYAQLLERDGLPDYFKKMYVTFTDGENVNLVVRADYGQALSHIPAVPEKEGYTGTWEDFDASAVVGDCTVKAVYVHPVKVLEAAAGDMRVLVQGSFGTADALTLRKSGDAWVLTIPEDGLKSHTVHVRVPDGKKSYYPELARDGVWTKADAKRDGSFLLLDAPERELTFRLSETSDTNLSVILGMAGAVLLLSALLIFRRRKRE